MKKELPYRFKCQMPVIPSNKPVKFTKEQQKEIDENFERLVKKFGLHNKKN